MPNSIALQRGKHALAAINGLPGTKKADVGNYLAYVKGLPANILRSGLGQAMAMEKAGAAKTGEDSKGHKFLFGHMEQWLKTDWQNSPYRGHQGDILHAMVNNDQAKYVRAQAEALAYLEWLKKFAVAFLDEDAPPPTSAGETEDAQ